MLRISMLAVMIQFFIFKVLAAKSDKVDVKDLYHKLAIAKSDTSQTTALLYISKYFRLTYTDSALIYAKKAYQLSKATNYRIIKTTRNLGRTYGMIEDYENSNKYEIEAMNAAQKIHDEKEYAPILIDIGSNYLGLNDYNKANEYFVKALKFCKTYSSKFSCYINLGQILSSQNDKVKYLQAHEQYNKALKLAEEAHNNDDQVLAYNRIGELYLLEGQFSNSIFYLEKSLKMIGETGPDYYRVDDMKCLAENYLSTGRYETGIRIAKQADSIAQRGGFIYEQQFLNSTLSQLYDSLGKPALSLIYYKKCSVIKDSIFNLDKNKRMGYLQIQFETKQHELEAKHYQQEAAFNKKLNYFYIVVMALICSTLFYFFKSLREKVKILKYEQERLVQQKEKERLEKHTIELELDKKHREVLTHVMQISQQKELFTTVLSDVNNIIKIEEPAKLMSSVKQLEVEIKNKIDLSDDWDQIKLHFENVHPDFFTKMKNNFPDISINDLKLIAYTKLKFSNKEISRLLNINPSSVQVSRYRLKKKMNLHEDVNLMDYIMNLE